MNYTHTFSSTHYIYFIQVQLGKQLMSPVTLGILEQVQQYVKQMGHLLQFNVLHVHWVSTTMHQNNHIVKTIVMLDPT